MKSSGVTGAGSMLAVMAGGLETTGTVQNSPEFGMFLDQKASQGMADTSDLLPNLSVGNPQLPKQSYEKETAGASYREITKAGATDTAQKAKELKEPYEELKEEVKEVLAKELGISKEELERAMEVLGITFEDLLGGDGLKALVMEINGSEDMAELLFSDVFQALGQELEAMVAEFTQQADLTPEEWELVLQKLQEMEDYSQISEETTELETSQEVTEGSDAFETDPTKEQPVISVEVQKAEQPKENNGAEVSGVQDQNAVTEETENTEETGNGQEFGAETGKEQGAGKKAAVNQDTPQPQATYQQTQTTVNAAGDTVIQTVERSFVDVQDIMNQITQFTRVTVAQSQSSIEMQLNPAHLGKIYLQVVSKEGMITAQIAAQNEAVKQALETQVAALKENMNQQGLKVEAVEVTIASHEFEQNLEGRQQENQESSGRGERSSRRFLSADQLDELAGTLSEEDSLAAKIMLENGNSMDMTA